jgi:hypothetical protein
VCTRCVTHEHAGVIHRRAVVVRDPLAHALQLGHAAVHALQLGNAAVHALQLGDAAVHSGRSGCC